MAVPTFIIDMQFKMLNEIGAKERDLSLFDLAVDSRLCSSDLVTLPVSDIAQTGRIRDRVTVIRQQTGRPRDGEIGGLTRIAHRRSRNRPRSGA
jgi:hypothetical protein